MSVVIQMNGENLRKGVKIQEIWNKQLLVMIEVSPFEKCSVLVKDSVKALLKVMFTFYFYWLFQSLICKYQQREERWYEINCTEIAQYIGSILIPSYFCETLIKGLVFIVACKIRHTDVRMQWERALLYFESGDYRKCVDIYQTIIKVIHCH